MRTNIDIDDERLAAAMQATGAKTKQAAVEEGLQLLITRARQLKAWEDADGIDWVVTSTKFEAERKADLRR